MTDLCCTYSFFKANPSDSLSLSALDLVSSGTLDNRGLATSDREIVWCCQNSTTYITINLTAQIVTDPSFDAKKILQYAVEDVQELIVQYGNAIIWGGQWGLQLGQRSNISADDTGDQHSEAVERHLNWAVLRDGLKALNDFVISKNLTHNLRGLEFGINSAFVGRVGQASIF